MTLSMILITVCLTIGIILFLVFAILATFQFQQRNWPRMFARVVDKGVVWRWDYIQSFFEVQHYSVVNEYEYKVNGKKYVGREKADAEIGARAIYNASKSRIGDKIIIHYNPKNPAKSTMRPGIKKSTYYYFWFSVCWLMIVVLIFGLYEV